MTRIPLVRPDLPPYDVMAPLFQEMLATGRITNFGPHVQDFEAAASAYLGCGAVTVSSGTLGLVFALQALGLQPGQRVALPSFTFMATAQAILYAGGVPVFVEIGDDLTIDVADLAEVLDGQRDIACVMPVHMYGLPCDVDAVDATVRIASRQRGERVRVLYDAAHAFGSRRHGQPVGRGGDAEVFSLSATKVLVSIEGGIVSSRDPDVLACIRSSRNYGIDRPYDARLPGANGKMSELHAAVGRYNLGRLDLLMAARQRLADHYLERLSSETVFTTPPRTAVVEHSYKDFTILMPPTHVDDRDHLAAYLAAEGVDTRAYFSPPVHRQARFAQFADRPLPRTDTASRQVLTLPFATTMPIDEVDRVVDLLRRAPAALGWGAEVNNR